MKKVLVAALALFAVGCGQSTSKIIQRVPYNEDILLIASVEDSGGALGETEYAISYVYKDQKTKFFQGSNPRDFGLSVREGVINIRFCDGNIDLAQPIFLSAPISELIHVNVVMYCSEVQPNP